MARLPHTPWWAVPVILGRRADLGLVGICVVTSFVLSAVNLSTWYQVAVPLALLLALGVAACQFLAYFRPAFAIPTAAFTIALLMLVLGEAPNLPTPLPVIVMIALFLSMLIAGVRSPWFIAGAIWLIPLAVAVSAEQWLGPPLTAGRNANLIVYASVGFSVVVVAVILRQWQLVRAELAVQRGATEVETQRRQRVEERAQIARELHDVVAHGMSLVAVQATTARYRHTGLPEAVIDEFEEIAGHSRRAMAEMRQLLGVLRSDGTEPDLLPQPDAARLDDLVAAMRQAGVEVRLSVPEAFSPGPLLGLTVYRIVQEALSNVVRHAAGAAAQVTISQHGDWWRVVVENGPVPAKGRGAAILDSMSEALGVGGEGAEGHGLRGMGERVHAVGGHMVYGDVSTGGFRLVATLPASASAAPSVPPSPLQDASADRPAHHDPAHNDPAHNGDS